MLPPGFDNTLTTTAKLFPNLEGVYRVGHYDRVWNLWSFYFELGEPFSKLIFTLKL